MTEHFAGKKVLVVDDEKIFREIMADYLRKENCFVQFAEDGQKAIAIAKNEQYDLIILDIYMPGLSGLDTLLALKKFCPELPVIMVTAKDSSEAYRESMRLGASDYLPKPVTKEKLFRTIATVFDRQSHVLSEMRWLKGFERLKKGAQTLRDTVLIGTDDTKEWNIDEFINRIVTLISEVLDVKTVSILNVNHGTQRMDLLASFGLDDKLIRSAPKLVGEGIAGYVAQSGEPLLVVDVRADSRFHESAFASQYETKSLLCVPIIVNGKIEGVVNVNNKNDGNPFDEKDLSLLSMFSHNIEFVMAHMTLLRELQERLKELTLLYHINRKLTETLTITSTVEELLATVHYAFNVEVSSLLLLKEDGKKLYYKAVIGDKWGLVKHFELEAGEGFAGWTVQNRQSILSNDVSSDERFSTRLDRYIGFKTRNSLCVPIVANNQVLGVVELINKKGDQSFNERDKVLLETIAAQTGLSLKNAWLHSNLTKRVHDAMETQKRETNLKKILKQKIQEIEHLRKGAVITFRIEDE